MPLRLAVAALLVGFGAMQLVVRTSPLGARGTLLVGQGALLLAFVAAALVARRPWREAFSWRPVAPGAMLLAAGCGVSLWVASAGLLQLQYAVWPMPPDMLRIFEALHGKLDLWPPGQGVLSLLAIAVGPAVSEEVAFRGALLGAVRRHVPEAPAIVLSAIPFALVHFPYLWPFTFGLGVVLGVLRRRTASILPGAIAHAALNTTTVLVTARFHDASVPGESVSVPLGLAVLVLGAAMSIAFGAGLGRSGSTLE
jgi:membrane protease YdiL (CAAX protease family)